MFWEISTSQTTSLAKSLVYIRIQKFGLEISCRSMIKASHFMRQKINPKLAMMATMMQDKTANPMSFLPFLYKADDSDNISLEALYLFNYIYEHG